MGHRERMGEGSVHTIATALDEAVAKSEQQGVSRYGLMHSVWTIATHAPLGGDWKARELREAAQELEDDTAGVSVVRGAAQELADD